MIPISEVAARVGVTVRTLRYYEEVGLLKAAERGPGGVRHYTEAEVERLKRIIDLRNSRGFTLDEVKAWLAAEIGIDAMRATYHGQDDVAAKLQALSQAEALLQGELAVIEAKIQGLVELQQQTMARLERARRLRAQLPQTK